MKLWNRPSGGGSRSTQHPIESFEKVRQAHQESRNGWLERQMNWMNEFWSSSYTSIHFHHPHAYIHLLIRIDFRAFYSLNDSMESKNQEGSIANSWFNASATLWQGRHEKFQPQILIWKPHISSYINLIWKQGLWPRCKLYGWLIKPIRNWVLFTTHLHCYLKGMKKIILWTITKYWATQFECVGFLNSLVEEVNDRAQLCIYCPSTKSLTVCPEETLTELISLYRRCSYHF